MLQQMHLNVIRHDDISSGHYLRRRVVRSWWENLSRGNVGLEVEEEGKGRIRGRGRVVGESERALEYKMECELGYILEYEVLGYGVI